MDRAATSSSTPPTSSLRIAAAHSMAISSNRGGQKKGMKCGTGAGGCQLPAHDGELQRPPRAAASPTGPQHHRLALPAHPPNCNPVGTSAWAALRRRRHTHTTHTHTHTYLLDARRRHIRRRVRRLHGGVGVWCVLSCIFLSARRVRLGGAIPGPKLHCGRGWVLGGVLRPFKAQGSACVTGRPRADNPAPPPCRHIIVGCCGASAPAPAGPQPLLPLPVRQSRLGLDIGGRSGPLQPPARHAIA